MPKEKVETKIDAAEATRLLNWLEEERQADKALLADLQKRVEQHESRLARGLESIDDLQDKLSLGTIEPQGASRFERTLQQFKDEILLELRRSEERLRKEDETTGKQLREERRERAEALAKLQQRIDAALKIGNTLQAQQAEIARLTKTASTLQQQMDEALKQVKSQQQKLLDFGELVRKSEETMSKLFKADDEDKARFESARETLRLAEARLERATQQMSEQEKSYEQLRQEHAQLADEMRKMDDRNNKRITGWAKEMTSWRQDVGQLREQMGLADKQYRSGERMLSDMGAMKIQLEKDRESLRHMELTAEERQRQQLEDWRKENELLWKRNDERWDQQEEDNAKRDERIALLWETHMGYLRRQATDIQNLINGIEKRLLRRKK